MATTFTAAALTSKGLVIGHIGDTRLYVMRRGRLEQVTQDHNVAAELVSSGAISAEEARTHPQRNVLTRTVGIDPATDPDVLQLRVRRGDRVLICSDGLHGLVASDQIAAVLSTGTPVFAANQLVEIANETGGSDNITAVVADVVRVRGRKMKRSSADTTSTNVSDDSTVEV
jgi:protein phosphatase